MSKNVSKDIDKSEEHPSVVWIVSEFHYDWYEFESFVGVAKTKQAALKLTKEIYGNVDFPITFDEQEHQKLAAEDRSHFYLFKKNVYEERIPEQEE